MSIKANNFYSCVAQQCAELGAPTRVIYEVSLYQLYDNYMSVYLYELIESCNASAHVDMTTKGEKDLSLSLFNLRVYLYEK
jgi:hypothetical protein